MDLAINNPSWKLIGTPWKKEEAPINFQEGKLIGTPWKKEEAPATTQVAKAKAAA